MSGYCLFSQPSICFGDQFILSFEATIRFSIGCWASLQGFGRCALSQVALSASLARYAFKPPLRLTSRLIVEGERPSSFAMVRKDRSQAMPLEISSRSQSVSANLVQCRGGGRIPPVGDSWENIEDDGRSNTRPMALRDSPCCQRSHISVFCSAVYFIRVLYVIFNTPSFCYKIKVLHRPVEVTV